ncbi:hypothetical protein PBY51_022182 [Eleginops maclovinus]|uniref:Uncharacterized protein n=1 Tax=Eleginops maclovinus TaxID=56733 RepID=A0AAN7XHA5_ELEMC|nr:hypothetical protein PBY51_022182 [Eleginops maclovinus]
MGLPSPRGGIRGPPPGGDRGGGGVKREGLVWGGACRRRKCSAWEAGLKPRVKGGPAPLQGFGPSGFPRRIEEVEAWPGFGVGDDGPHPAVDPGENCRPAGFLMA